MSKRVFYSILIPALLLIGGYAALHIFLRTGTSGNSEEKPEQLVTTQQSSARKGVTAQTAAADTITKDKEKPAPKKDDREAAGIAEKSDSTEKENESPLDLRPLFINKLQELVKKSSNGLYALTVGELELDMLSSTVSLHNVAIRPESRVLQQLKEAGKLPQNVLSLSFEDLLIDGINIDDAINSKSMDYKLIKLVNPVVEIDRYKTGSEEGNSANFSQGFLQQMEKLAIEKLEVEGGTIAIHDKINGGTKKLENVQVLLQDILLNDATRNDKDRFLFAKQAQLEFHDFKMPVKGGLYNFTIGDAFVYATEKKVTLKNMAFGSPLSKEAFDAKQELAAEKYDLLLPSLSISGVDWWTAMNGEEINASNVETEGGKLAVYFNRSLPPKDKTGNFPNQLLKKLSMPIEVENLTMQNIDLSYEEFNPRSGQSGTVNLDDITMSIKNITNKESNDKPMVVDGSALLMQRIPLNATFTFNMEKATKGVFAASMQLDSFGIDVINTAAKPLGLLEAERGRVHKIDVRMQGDETAASGEVLVLYDKLRLSLMKKDKHDDSLKKKHLLSFLANVLVIKNNNPWWLTGKMKKKEAYFKRDTEAGFMNLVWKTAFVGLLKTVGAPEKMAKKK